MLLTFSAFLLKEGIRSPIYLLNPPVIKQEEISLPRFSILHYLDYNTDIHFPTRNLPYFKTIDKNKRIPIYHITDLITKDEVLMLLNKKVEQEVRKWNQSNIKEFKSVNLTETPNQDINVISVYNYNLLKDLYKYKSSLLSSYYKYVNLQNTLWHYVKLAINKENDSYQFIKIELPNVIPNANIIDVILKFNPVKYTRVVTDIRLMQIIDIYKWLVDETRKNSTLKDISDEDSNRIIIEFSYKGYSSFLPLYIIRGICNESNIESQSKVPAHKAKRLFILSLYKIQNKINAYIEQDLDSKEEDNTNNIEEKIEKSYQDEDDYDDETNKYPQKVNLNEDNETVRRSKFLRDIEKQAEDKIMTAINQGNVDIEKILDEELNQIDTSETDSIFKNSIIKADSEKELEEKEEEQEDKSPLNVNTNPEHIENILRDKTLEDKFENYIKEATQFKLLTSQEIRTLKKLYEERQNLKSPYDPNVQIDEFVKIQPDETKLTQEDTKLEIDNPLVTDNLKKENVLNSDRKYLNKIMKKDIIACVKNIEKAGIIIKDYTIEKDYSVLGRYEIHKLTLKPLNGKESTIYFRLPEIDEEGEFIASGVKYRMRKQRTDLPIRKISPTRVALTSNYGKLFVFRTDRKAFDYYGYIVDYIKNTYISGNGNIVKIQPGNLYSNTISLPNVYANMSMHFASVETDKYKFIFNYKQIPNYIDDEVIKDLKSKNLVFIGYDKSNNNNILVVDYQDNIYNYTNNMEKLGDIVDLLEIDRTKVPKPFTMINILGDGIPLGVVMGYYLGISNLIALTGAKYEIIESTKQYKPDKNDVILKFEDYKLIIKNASVEQELLFNGFLFFKDFIKRYKLKSFDQKEVYLDLLEYRNLSLLHIKELNTLEELFMDPITVDVLRSMNEPTDFFKLLLRANELLKDFSYPDPNDPKYCRIRGVDRVAGLMYRALSESVRTYKFKNNAKSKIELDPYKVWNYVTQDNTVKISEDNNPITDRKEMEAVTLTGIDGLSKDAVPVYLRRFHKNDMGFISEATVDSGDVAVNTYLTPYARFRDVRGLIDIDNKEHIENKAKLFSTSVLLAPGSDQDDPKRVNFINIQNGHTIMAEGYMQPLLRTGYEYVVPYEVGKLYCSIAKDDGVVIEKTDKILTVKYNNGEIESVPLGTRYGKLEGTIHPHELVTQLKVGDKFKKNDYLSYNTGFFEPDWLDPSKLILKFNRVVTVALTMTNEVFEDSSAISTELSKDMTTYVVKERSFIIEFNKHITGLLPEGTEVEPNDVLFTVLDENTDYSNLSESTIEMLQSLASLSPKAKVKGVIEKYEMRYNGELSDMSPSLRKLATRLDKELYEETKGTFYEVKNGSVTSEYRVNGKNLNPDTLELKVYIRVRLTQAVGDKGVFANQMKSVISDVYTHRITTESGERVDALFSYRGMLNRIVNSPILIGTTNRLLKHVSKQVAKIYFGS